MYNCDSLSSDHWYPLKIDMVTGICSPRIEGYRDMRMTVTLIQPAYPGSVKNSFSKVRWKVIEDTGLYQPLSSSYTQGWVHLQRKAHSKHICQVRVSDNKIHYLKKLYFQEKKKICINFHKDRSKFTHNCNVLHYTILVYLRHIFVSVLLVLKEYSFVKTFIKWIICLLEG